MKTLSFLLLLVTASAFAQNLSFEEAMAVLDKNASILNNIKVGEQTIDESYETLSDNCVLHEKVLSTLVEIRGTEALVAKDYTFTNKCTGETFGKKFLVINKLVEVNATKAYMKKHFAGHNINLRDWLLTFEKQDRYGKHTYQYDLRYNLFNNWVHHHHSYPGVEDHNIKYEDKFASTLPDVSGLPLCEMDVFTQDFRCP